MRDTSQSQFRTPYQEWSALTVRNILSFFSLFTLIFFLWLVSCNGLSAVQKGAETVYSEREGLWITVLASVSHHVRLLSLLYREIYNKMFPFGYYFPFRLRLMRTKQLLARFNRAPNEKMKCFVQHLSFLSETMYTWWRQYRWLLIVVRYYKLPLKLLTSSLSLDFLLLPVFLV